MKHSVNDLTVKDLAVIGLLTAILLIMSYTPLGYLNIGPLAVTFNVIPVAVAGFVLGPVGGGIVGGVFGLTSFLQCFGGSALGTALFGINPVLTVIQCFVPRILDGILTGLFSGIVKSKNVAAAGFAAGFSAAFLNTLFYMTSLMLLFGNSELILSYREKVAPGKNVILFVAAFVGVNAVAEMISSTLITGAVSAALWKSGLTDTPERIPAAAEVPVEVK